jgi:hypothetical protein
MSELDGAGICQKAEEGKNKALAEYEQHGGNEGRLTNGGLLP